MFRTFFPSMCWFYILLRTGLKQLVRLDIILTNIKLWSFRCQASHSWKWKTRGGSELDCPQPQHQTCLLMKSSRRPACLKVLWAPVDKRSFNFFTKLSWAQSQNYHAVWAIRTSTSANTTPSRKIKNSNPGNWHGSTTPSCWPWLRNKKKTRMHSSH